MFESISEFFAGIMEEMCRKMYTGLEKNVQELYGGMMEVMNNQIAQSRNLVTQSPQSWNASAFNFIQAVAENAFIPVAGCILTCVTAYEVISIVQDRNHGHNFTIEELNWFISKLVLCILACGYSFKIVMGFFDISTIVSDKIAAVVSTENVTMSGTLNFATPSEYDFSCVIAMLGNYLVTWLCMLFTYVLAVMIFLRVILWIVELLIYSAPASVPFATFMNKEWGQTGQNYIRKMLAVCFEGSFMLLAFGLYKYIVSNIAGTGLLSGSDFILAMMMSLGCGIVLFILLTKVGTISASIFHAH